MTLEIKTHILGPLFNNTYLLGDIETRQAVVIDPSFDIERLIECASRGEWSIVAVWLTHAHFDHFAGAWTIMNTLQPIPLLGLHPGDLALLKDGGGSKTFGIHVKEDIEPSLMFEDGQILPLGNSKIQVRHVPGHTAGHVIFYLPDDDIALCGDVIFRGSVGRTDLPEGNHSQLIQCIRSQILTLPPNTRLLSGHGPETTVAEERDNNPYL